MRLIDADELKKKAFTLDEENGLIGKDIVTVEDIDNAPTVESNISETYGVAYEQGFRHGKEKYERPQGEWIFQYTFLDDNLYKCSSCNRLLSIDVEQDIEQFLFCPNCGAKMSKQDESI